MNGETAKVTKNFCKKSQKMLPSKSYLAKNKFAIKLDDISKKFFQQTLKTRKLRRKICKIFFPKHKRKQNQKERTKNL